jgi:hypothetical protein
MKSYTKEEIKKIEFKGEKRFLSNMFETKIIFDDMFDIEIEDVEPTFLTYKSSEHLYQALKSKSILWHYKLIELTPLETKNIARKKLKTLLADNKETFLIREDWDKIKINVMKLVLLLKFKQNKELAKKLKNLKGNIEEKNIWNDRFWGTVEGIGENNLGKLLMEIRELLIKEELR